ncbi:sigma D regulator [Alloalcanivorax xenomutans]|uniref:sigma D regulator n=1 Tax=Alloalcanivorax xenomutans TaxID=1094342 RepID=UPI001F26D615|nr:sigma D regulator [Alloalcanivorax xenomutans]MCE7524677.1 sigma D regulator [Alloalcanivorax xenomutans]
MASSSSTALAQWQHIEALVQAWLEERRQLIVLLCQVQGIDHTPSREEPDTPVHQRIQDLCQVLMDYLSAGYFEVYNALVRAARHYGSGPPQWAEQLIQRLDASTEEALAFNEDYDSPTHCMTRLTELPERVARLIVALEERFALEDQLIVSLYQEPAPAARAEQR